MKPELNCSSLCHSPLCSIQSRFNTQDSLDILQRLCGLNLLKEELPRRSPSPVLTAVMWTLLSCGILSAFCFLFFTLRFKNNRIVKMSSPNLNILTLFGSVLTYISGFLFAIDDRATSLGGRSTAVLQARVWTLCVGSTLVFGPILGKTWRLYRVFTQRVPDKRVIIRDIQLIGIVAALTTVDIVILTAWNFVDPIRCSRSIGAVVKVVERDVSFSLSPLESCSSVYSNIWIIVITAQKGCLLLYGTYLAGLTSNVSHPPVNQSPTIITAITLVTFTSAVAVPVSIFLNAWPNLVYSVVAGAIFICTLATNCVLFVPQLTQWRQFEDDQNNPSQMAKYFSSPSKSQPSVYSQDEIYFLLGENSSMKKLLNEKNAAIDSLQEQVNNAKEKLLRLMTASQQLEEQDMDSSNTNLNSSSTQTTDLMSDGLSNSLGSQTDRKSRPSEPLTAALSNTSSASASKQNASPLICDPEDVSVTEAQGSAFTTTATVDSKRVEPRKNENLHQPVVFKFPGRTTEETVQFVTSLQTRRGVKATRLETLSNHSGLTLPTAQNGRPTGFVSSEQLQEILKELSVDAVTETTLRSPGQTSSQLKLNTLSPQSLKTSCSPRPPSLFQYPSISPYAMRKRRPPFHSSRRSLAPPCFYTGSKVPVCGKKRNTSERRNSEVETLDETLHAHNGEPEGEKEEEEKDEDVNPDGQEARKKHPRRVLKSHRCSHCRRAAPHVPQEDGDTDRHLQHIRDSSGYWDSDSSSSMDYCYYHRPYCDSYLSSDSSSDSSDSEYEDYTNLYRSSRPVVFKDDIKPTFV